MGRTGEESLHLQVYSAASDESSGKSFMEPDDEALMNLLALPFLCRGWLLAGFIFIPGALLQGLGSCSFHLCAWTPGVR